MNTSVSRQFADYLDHPVDFAEHQQRKAAKFAADCNKIEAVIRLRPVAAECLPTHLGLNRTSEARTYCDRILRVLVSEGMAVVTTDPNVVFHPSQVGDRKIKIAELKPLQPLISVGGNAKSIAASKARSEAYQRRIREQLLIHLAWHEENQIKFSLADLARKSGCASDAIKRHHPDLWNQIVRSDLYDKKHLINCTNKAELQRRIEEKLLLVESGQFQIFGIMDFVKLVECNRQTLRCHATKEHIERIHKGIEQSKVLRDRARIVSLCERIEAGTAHATSTYKFSKSIALEVERFNAAMTPELMERVQAAIEHSKKLKSEK